MKLTSTQIACKNPSTEHVYILMNENCTVWLEKTSIYLSHCMLFTRKLFLNHKTLFIVHNTFVHDTAAERFFTAHRRCEFNYHYKSHLFDVGKTLKGDYKIQFRYVANCFKQKILTEASVIQFYLLLWKCVN